MLAPQERRLLIALTVLLAAGSLIDWLAVARPREIAWLVGAERVEDLRQAGVIGAPNDERAGEPAGAETAMKEGDTRARPERKAKGAKSARRAGVYDLQGRLDLNAADSLELVALTGVGPSMAGRILAERRRRGRFDGLEQLQEVRGIGPKTFERLKPRLFVRNRPDRPALTHPDPITKDSGTTRR